MTIGSRLYRPDPTGDLRVLITKARQRSTAFVFLAVKENSVWRMILRPSQLVQEFIEMDDLFHRIRPWLLPVAEGAVGDPDLRGGRIGTCLWLNDLGRLVITIQVSI